MIYDCFTFFNELDLLEIRLNILNDIVDKFVIVEGTKTFKGNDKPLNFKANEERFEKFKDKIIYVVFNDYPESDNPWLYENLQRNAIAQGLVNCNDDDIILISDLDEIINPEAIKRGIESLNKGTPIKKFVQYNMNYFLNTINCKIPLWLHPEMCTYKNFKNCLDNIEDYNYNTFTIKEVNQGTTANKIRMYEDCDLIEFGGWHFSFLGGAEKIIYKIKNFSHQELVPQLDSIMASVAQNIENINTTNTSKQLSALKYQLLPEYLQKNIDKYQKYISETQTDKLKDFKDISNPFFKEIKRKYIRYNISKYLTFGKARKRYNHKAKRYSRIYNVLKFYK